MRLSLSVPPSDLSILHLEKIIYQYFPINVACSTKCENCKNNLSLFYFKCCQMTVLFIGNIHIENKLDKTHTLFYVEANHVTKMTYYKKCWLIMKNYNVIWAKFFIFSKKSQFLIIWFYSILTLTLPVWFHSVMFPGNMNYQLHLFCSELDQIWPLPVL